MNCHQSFEKVLCFSLQTFETSPNLLGNHFKRQSEGRQWTITRGSYVGLHKPMAKCLRPQVLSQISWTFTVRRINSLIITALKYLTEHKSYGINCHFWCLIREFWYIFPVFPNLFPLFWSIIFIYRHCCIFPEILSFYLKFPDFRKFPEKVASSVRGIPKNIFFFVCKFLKILMVLDKMIYKACRIHKKSMNETHSRYVLFCFHYLPKTILWLHLHNWRNLKYEL